MSQGGGMCRHRRVKSMCDQCKKQNGSSSSSTVDDSYDSSSSE